MDDVKRDQKALSKEARKAAQERAHPMPPPAARGRPRNWAKMAAIGLFVLLVGGVGVLQVMPLSTADYEKGASEALGVPVRISSARLSVITGIEIKLEGVSIGDAVKIRELRGFPEAGSLFGARKVFSRVELEGVTLSQAQLGDVLFGKSAGENFRTARVVVKQLSMEGPLKLPPLDVDAVVAGDGTLQSLKLSGGDKLVAQLNPKGGEATFEISAASLDLPFVPALNLSEFGMKGTATRQGVSAATFDGRAFDGVVSGTARIRWGASWSVDGEVRARSLKVAVFAPALVSEGKVEGRANYTMSGSDPAMLAQGARMQGEFKIEKGVMGSFDLTRALQTGGAQTAGRTVFTELTGQGVYDKGAVQLRNIAVSAGAMNAGASLDIDVNGGLAGRVSADVKTPNQTLRAVLNLSGKVQDPVIRK
jgi:cytoskeletal protein CcmA (bactofilin family)